MRIGIETLQKQERRHIWRRSCFCERLSVDSFLDFKLPNLAGRV